MHHRSSFIARIAVGLFVFSTLSPITHAAEQEKPRSFTIAAMKVEPKKWDKQTNYALLERYARQAAKHGAEMLVTCEGYLDGYTSNPKMTPDLTREKFFAVGKCFRNETVDWSHGFEFNQTEGIVIDKNANFRHLLGYLKEFFGKMGFKKIKFTPAYFPYTEPSVEILAFHPEKKVWLELGGAGIFRPEVVIPLMGEFIPVLAWGPGLDRILLDYYKIKDLRELYKNDIKTLREKKVWIK